MRVRGNATLRVFKRVCGAGSVVVLLAGCASSPDPATDKAADTATKSIEQAMRSVIVPKLHIRPADLMWRYQDGKVVYDDASDIRDPKRFELRARNLSMLELFDLICYLSDNTYDLDKNGLTRVPDVATAAQRPEDANQEKVLVAKLKGITIPEVTFRLPATVFDAIEFFHQASADYDEPSIPVQLRGVNFAVRNPYPLTFNPSAARKEPIISGGHDSFCTLYDALTNLCANANARFTVRDNTVVIYPAAEKKATPLGGR